MSELFEVTVDSIRVSLTTQQRVLILHEPKNELYLPIWIGSFEAESIVIALQGIEVSRPQPHDLLKNVIAALDGKLRNVVLSKIQDDTFYSFLVLESQGNEILVDSRPSDAISLAIRCKVPIFVDKTVLLSAGIQPEKDIRELNSAKKNFAAEPDQEEFMDDAKLNIFDDFLKNIDLPDSGETGKNDRSGKQDNEKKDTDSNSDDLLFPI
ncbi:MAG TPA: bifunctional nuclease family protein [Flexilinea sp.]|nr:bifunctional nuclease family protein [Flexilinea sp.]HOW07062.1 bifunctional nuclease family protein [Flexilinea sp.]